MHPVYVLKRPHVDEFLESVGKLYECVLFTASLAEVKLILKFVDLFKFNYDIIILVRGSSRQFS